MATTDLSVYDKVTIPNAKDFRFGIVVSEWNSKITNGLLEGAKQTLLDNGVNSDAIKVWDVPGSFELIYGAKKMQEQNVNAVIAIGSVIQGETKHFDFVCDGVSQGIKDLNVLHDTPVIFCVLTDNNMQQAIDRSGGQHGNKGVEAAVAAIKMAELRRNA
ncbi:6,7-dimethyl-8-ribityllumazine synthase [Aurantibacter sp.]|uniref:6,7-dimethyl-8-ribityllumazine synthase n=1 Tax=Aurantibacter sp. TaxID=2807103 RepID=UPI0035C7E6A5